MGKMIGYIATLVVSISCFSCNVFGGKGGDDQDVLVKAVPYEALQKRINVQDDTLYVVNFWATWCVPCVKELPEFMQINEKYGSGHKFKMILVSLDNAKSLDTKVLPFIKARNLAVEHYLLDDNKRMNEWIPAFDESWSGAIPATVIYKNGKKLSFHESSLNREELENLIIPHLK